MPAARTVRADARHLEFPSKCAIDALRSRPAECWRGRALRRKIHAVPAANHVNAISSRAVEKTTAHANERAPVRIAAAV
jgi:hypothetical protein